MLLLCRSFSRWGSQFNDPEMLSCDRNTSSACPVVDQLLRRGFHGVANAMLEILRSLGSSTWSTVAMEKHGQQDVHSLSCLSQLP